MIDERCVGEFDIRSKQYEQLMSNIINEFNNNGKKTVLVTCDTYFPTVDGVVMVIHNCAQLLSDKMNVMLLVPTYKNKVYMKGYPAIGVMSGYSKKLCNQVPLPMFDTRFRKLLKKLRIDIIHCHSPFMIGRTALKLHRKRNIPLVSTFHSQYKKDFQKQAKLLVPILMHYIMKCYNGSNEVWTMHSASRDTLLSYGYKGNVMLVPNGTMIQPADDYPAERQKTREKYGVNDETVLFIFVGRLVTLKNILFIVDVLAVLKKYGLDFKMIYAGDGPDREKLLKRIQDNNLTNEVLLLGQLNRENVTELYAAADMFLFPSLYDVSSLVQVEAASRFTPTVFAEGSVTSCTITNGVNGYIFPVDTELFAKGVYNALQDKNQLHDVGVNAHKDIYITWNTITEKIHNRYLELIEENKKQ